MTSVLFKKEKKVIEYALKAVALYNPGTVSLTGDNIYYFERIVYILGGMITVQGFKDYDEHLHSLISRAIARFRSYKKKTLFCLKKALEAELNESKKQQAKKFTVVFPINLKQSTLNNKRHFTLNRTKLNIHTLNYVLKKFDFKQTNVLPNVSIDKSKGISSLSGFTFITIDVFAKNEIKAFEKTHRLFAIFRALSNFSLSYGHLTIQIGYPSALGSLNPPKNMFVFDSNRKYKGDWSNVGEFNYRLVSLTPDELKAVLKTINDYDILPDNSLKNVLTNCLTLHQYALDSIEPAYIFLNFWQILELVSLKDQLGNTENKVKTRITAIYKNNSTISDILEVLFCKRNHLVHEGRLEDFSLSDVNEIKGIAEGAMSFLFSQVEKLENYPNLETFYENIKEKDKVKDKLRILNYIIKLP
jgi:hypothetical protein